MQPENGVFDKMTTIDLNDLLDGNPTWDEVVDFWKNGEFYGEEYLVPAIKRYLRTEEHRKLFYDADCSIEEFLNCRFTEDQWNILKPAIKDWNDKLGFEAFASFYE